MAETPGKAGWSEVRKHNDLDGYRPNRWLANGQHKIVQGGGYVVQVARRPSYDAFTCSPQHLGALQPQEHRAEGLVAVARFQALRGYLVQMASFDVKKRLERTTGGGKSVPPDNILVPCQQCHDGADRQDRLAENSSVPFDMCAPAISDAFAGQIVSDGDHDCDHNTKRSDCCDFQAA